MYSERIIERNQNLIESRIGRPLVRYSSEESEGRTEELKSIWDQKARNTIRPLSKEEGDFILNEQLLSTIDYKYFVERYYVIPRDGIVGGGIGKMRFGEAQLVLFNAIAKAQEEEYEKVERNYIPDGMLFVDHKARQVWHTMLCRTLLLHRMIFYPNTRAVTVSVDDEKLKVPYDRDLLCYDELPWFLQPQMAFNEKQAHISFANKSQVTYLAANKKSSLGQSHQFDIGHCTEVSEYEYATRLDADFFPTFPQAKDTLLVLESRANGRGNWWHDFSEKVRLGRKPRWRYCFVPWYAEPKKYRLTPPDGWEPPEVAILHAKKVYETSQEYVGKKVFLPREQLYWWYRTREEYRENGRLNMFLENYCATHSESFQHSGQSAFDAELLDELRCNSKDGMPYEFEREAA